MKIYFLRKFVKISCLVLVQHDQIKEELTKQEILPLLIRFATESKFNLIKVRLPALEILLALTFNNQAANQLKQNPKFISYLKTLSTQSTEQRLQRVAEGILWKIEKEQKDIHIVITIYVIKFMMDLLKIILKFGLIEIKCMDKLWLVEHFSQWKN